MATRRKLAGTTPSTETPSKEHHPLDDLLSVPLPMVIRAQGPGANVRAEVGALTASQALDGETWTGFVSLSFAPSVPVIVALTDRDDPEVPFAMSRPQRLRILVSSQDMLSDLADALQFAADDLKRRAKLEKAQVIEYSTRQEVLAPRVEAEALLSEEKSSPTPRMLTAHVGAWRLDPVTDETPTH